MEILFVNLSLQGAYNGIKWFMHEDMVTLVILSFMIKGMSRWAEGGEEDVSDVVLLTESGLINAAVI